MSSDFTFKDLDEFTPPGSKSFGLILFGWILSAIFNKYDTNYYFYTALLIIGATFTVYFIVNTRRKVFNVSVHYTYLVVWWGITIFVDFHPSWENGSITLYFLEYLCITPTFLHWLFPIQDDTFFGLQKLGDVQKIQWLWKLSIIYLLVLNIFQMDRSYEFLTIIPLILEPAILNKYNNRQGPLLTINLQEEMVRKFLVPISLARSIFIILVAYLFEYLTSKFWVLAILFFFAWGGLWAVIVMASKLTNKGSNEFTMEDIKEMFNDGVIDDEQYENFKEKLTSITALTKLETSDVETTLITLDGKRTEIKKGSSAFKMGQRFRREMQKPKYNLAHILSTLSENTFQNGYKVTTPNMTFQSIKGNWTPPDNLILFPVELGAFDFRRANEVLLLGFNAPEPLKGGKRTSITSSKGEVNLVMANGSIRFSNTEFNMKTLIVSKNEWIDMQSKLEKLTPTEDISFTGFRNVAHLQKLLLTMSDKWMELRKKFQETTVSFVAGLLGVEEPVFSKIKSLEPGASATYDAADEYEISDE